MRFYAKILEYRRLAAMLLGLLAAHLLILVLAIFAIIRYQQFWAIPAVLWLPLIIPALRKSSQWLQMVFTERHADLLAVNGITITDADETLSNVTEEIAVATGDLPPKVAICQSRGLNAFYSVPHDAADDTATVVFTSAMVETLNRHELQSVAAHLYAHRHGFDRLFITMAGAMYLAAFIVADIFLALTALELRFDAGGGFSTGPLVVILSTGMLVAPLATARLAQAWAMRRVRFLDDLEAIGITNDPDSLRSALENVSATGILLDANFDLANVHFYFTTVNDPAKKYPWQRLATYPTPDARAKAIGALSGKWA